MITFACATSHAPGITAWADAAPAPQKERIYGGFARLRSELDASGTDTLIVLTSEHWANFFLDHIGAFCIGRAERYSGPAHSVTLSPCGRGCRASACERGG